MGACIFAGTFDPVSKGHVAIIKKLKKKYKRVLIVVGENKDKSPLFNVKDRVDFIKASVKGIKGVKVLNYSEIKYHYIDVLKKENAVYYARGIRNDTDYLYEKEYEEINKRIYPFITTVYFYAGKYKNVSSTAIRNLILKGGDYKRYIPKKAYKLIKQAAKTVR